MKYLKVVRVLLAIGAIAFFMACIEAIMDIQRVVEHSGAWAGVLFSIVAFAWALYNPEKEEK